MVNGMLAMGEGGAIDPGLFGVGGMPGQMPGENMLAELPEEDRGEEQGWAGEERGVHDDGEAPEGEEEGNEDIEGDEEDIAVSSVALPGFLLF